MASSKPSQALHAPPLTAIAPSLIASHGFSIVMLSSIVRYIVSFSTLKEELTFYGTFHRDPLNQIIHFLDYPLLVGSLFIIFAHLPLPMGRLPFLPHILRLPFVRPHRLNYTEIATFCYTLFYLRVDLLGGILYFPFLYIQYAMANNWTVSDWDNAMNDAKKKIDKREGSCQLKSAQLKWYGTGVLLKSAFVAHALGWVIILFGHAVAEGALEPGNPMDGLSRAMTIAPFFSFYEGLWFIGLNRELQNEIKPLVDLKTVEFCREGYNIRACADYGF